MNDFLVQLCATQGHMTRADLLAIGLDDRAIYRAHQSGKLVRVRHGAYTLPHLWNELDPRGRHLVTAGAVVRNARSPVALSHTSALMMFGTFWWGLPLEEVHVTRLDGRSGRREAGVAQHRGAVRVDDVTCVGGTWVTSAARTALDLTTIARTEAAVVAIDGLVHAGLTTVPAIHARHAASPGRPYTLTTDLILRLVDGASESAGESRVKHVCWTQRLPRPELQYEIRQGGVLVARLDLAWPRHKVWVEFDGVGKYTSTRRPGESIEDVVLREKRREDLIRRLTGWICIRVNWADLERPGYVAHLLRQAFADQAAA